MGGGGGGAEEGVGGGRIGGGSSCKVLLSPRRDTLHSSSICDSTTDCSIVWVWAELLSLVVVSITEASSTVVRASK